MKKRRAFRHISAWAGILAPLLFAILVLIASLLRPGYSQISQNISDLGVGPSAILQNINFMLFGLLSISFARGLKGSLPATRTRAARGVVWLVAVFGVGIMFAGVSLVFVGTLPEQAVMAAHVLASFVAFFTIVAAQLFMWRALEDCERARWYRTYSLVSGLLSLALLFVFIFTANAAYHGVTERAFLAVPWLWIAVTGIRLTAFIKVQPFSEEAPNTRSFALTRLGSSFRLPRLMTREIALGGVCWLLSLEFFVGQAVAQSAWRTPYSLIGNAISDLGSTTCQTIHIGAYHGFVCLPWHVVMNASFMVTGALILFGFIFTRRAWSRGRHVQATARGTKLSVHSA